MEINRKTMIEFEACECNVVKFAIHNKFTVKLFVGSYLAELIRLLCDTEKYMEDSIGALFTNPKTNENFILMKNPMSSKEIKYITLYLLSQYDPNSTEPQKIFISNSKFLDVMKPNYRNLTPKDIDAIDFMVCMLTLEQRKIEQDPDYEPDEREKI